MKFKLTMLLVVITISFANANTVKEESLGLIKRLLPSHVDDFRIEIIEAEKGYDLFEIESKNHKIVLRGNNGVAIASALYHYLNEYAHCQVTWNGSNLNLPDNLPIIPKKVVKKTPYKLRYYLNYCTFNYSMSWWDWSRWEKEIDWMALHGINMPLAITGEEYTWYLVYKDLGFTDDELKDFFTGPAYFSWFWMGNIDKWGGPLPVQWMKNQFILQKKILQRERALGMKAVLPAFTGHVPSAFQNHFPKSKLKTTNWNNSFSDTYILDAEDAMFADIGKRFLQKQTELMGTDHYYSSDTFNENEPPSNDPQYLGTLSARIYDSMRQVDSSAVWVMQGWLFYSDRKFWGEEQTKALLNAVPDDKMIILDLATEIEPIWKRTDAFYGKPWVWNMLNNFGGNTNLFGRMDAVAEGPATALKDPNSGNMVGIGLSMEAIEQNPVLYELMTHNIWRNEPIATQEWLPKYVRNRYGKTNDEALKAWNILYKTVYTVPSDKYIRDGAESIIQARPTLESSAHWVKTKLNYQPKEILPAWQYLIKASSDLKTSEGYNYDLVDVTRQVLANYALILQQKWAKAYQEKNQPDFIKYSREFLELIDDMDALLGTNKDFLLGKWVSDARKLGTTSTEKALYEQNAKNLITLWGNENCKLSEYACRQWNGLLSSYYKPRWQQYIAELTKDLEGTKKFDSKAFDIKIRKWEWNWVNKREDFIAVPQGNSAENAKKMYDKYWEILIAAYD